MHPGHQCRTCRSCPTIGQGQGPTATRWLAPHRQSPPKPHRACCVIIRLPHQDQKGFPPGTKTGHQAPHPPRCPPQLAAFDLHQPHWPFGRNAPTTQTGCGSLSGRLKVFPWPGQWRLLPVGSPLQTVQRLVQKGQVQPLGCWALLLEQPPAPHLPLPKP